MIDRVETSRPWVALTFDDGPDPGSTPQVLNLLADHGAKATFFCVGRQAAEHPQLIARMAAEGHALGNHSWSHERFPELGMHHRVRELKRCQEALPRQQFRLFRPPFGDYSLGSAFDAWRKDYAVIGWDVLLWDWCERDADRILHLLRDGVKPGSIVLLHDALHVHGPGDYPPRDAMLDALGRWLGEAMGSFEFVTVPRLLQGGGRRIRRPIRRIPPTA